MVVDRETPATMRDGTVLRADVYRPESGGDFPVLLARTPYDKSGESAVEMGRRLAAALERVRARLVEGIVVAAESSDRRSP